MVDLERKGYETVPGLYVWGTERLAVSSREMEESGGRAGLGTRGLSGGFSEGKVSFRVCEGGA